MKSNGSKWIEVDQGQLRCSFVFSSFFLTLKWIERERERECKWNFLASFNKKDKRKSIDKRITKKKDVATVDDDDDENACYWLLLLMITSSKQKEERKLKK